jgi:hypothetical protein
MTDGAPRSGSGEPAGLDGNLIMHCRGTDAGIEYRIATPNGGVVAFATLGDLLRHLGQIGYFSSHRVWHSRGRRGLYMLVADAGDKKKALRAPLLALFKTLVKSIIDDETKRRKFHGEPTPVNHAMLDAKLDRALFSPWTNRKHQQQQQQQQPVCYVPDCGAELPTDPAYLYDARVCRAHARAESVFMGGSFWRFCCAFAWGVWGLGVGVGY